MSSEESSSVQGLDVEDWASRYLQSDSLASSWRHSTTGLLPEPRAAPLRVEAPGVRKSCGPPAAAAHPQRGVARTALRARAMHASFITSCRRGAHVLGDSSFQKPRWIQKGAARICLDEIRHMNLYAEHIRSLGSALAISACGWFWKRVQAFALRSSSLPSWAWASSRELGVAADFATRFRLAGDERRAYQERIAIEEVAPRRVCDALVQALDGGCDFQTWVTQRPPPSALGAHGHPSRRAHAGARG